MTKRAGTQRELIQGCETTRMELEPNKNPIPRMFNRSRSRQPLECCVSSRFSHGISSVVAVLALAQAVATSADVTEASKKALLRITILSGWRSFPSSAHPLGHSLAAAARMLHLPTHGFSDPLDVPFSDAQQTARI